MNRLSRYYLIVFTLFLTGCFATVAPHAVTTTQASFDGNQQNSGIVAVEADGFKVTKHFLDRHGFDVKQRGVTPSGDYYTITAELMADAIELDQHRKNAQK